MPALARAVRPVPRGPSPASMPGPASNAFSAYLTDLRGHSAPMHLLDRDEEHRLAERAVAGDQAAAALLVESNLRLVIRIAREYSRPGADHAALADLIQEGNLGLLRAVRRFDPSRNVRLSTYAAWWIRAYMLRFLVGNWRLVRIGTTQSQRKLFFGLRAERERLERAGQAAEPGDLAARFGVSETELAQMEQHLRAPEVAIDAAPDGHRQPSEILASEGDAPDAACEHDELIDRLRTRLDQFEAGLAPRDRELVNRRWRSDDPPTLAALGKQLGVSRERARQLELRLLQRFRRFFTDEATAHETRRAA